MMNPIITKTLLTDEIFWEALRTVPPTIWHETAQKAKYILSNFGTSEPCNRFDVGNALEFLLADTIRKSSLEVDSLPNARRIDICVDKTYNLSIKYSSTGDITLHNSNSVINTDITFTNMLLMTPSHLYLITNDNLKEHEVDIGLYLHNTGDSLKLKRKLLTKLETVGFPYRFPFGIEIDKKQCKNRLCSELFYKQVMSDYENSK